MPPFKLTPGASSGPTPRFAVGATSKDQDGVVLMLEYLLAGRLPEEEDVLSLLQRVTNVFAEMPTLVDVVVPPGSTLHVVGDIHGQFDELLRILQLCGKPVPDKNMILFNGDFVDRGDRSTEVVLVLFAMVLAYPDCIFLNRGNHETRAMNRVFGFEAEVRTKYTPMAFEAFQEVFRCLPLATVINSSVFVIHGGIPGSDGVKLADIAAIDRKCEPTSGLIMDILWSDPSAESGMHASPRGAGVAFGPDCTARFCDDNGLLCCIRSHEVKQGGFGWQPGGRCLTVFSAANYGGKKNNLGAVCHISPTSAEKVVLADIKCTTFASDRHKTPTTSPKPSLKASPKGQSAFVAPAASHGAALGACGLAQPMFAGATRSRL